MSVQFEDMEENVPYRWAGNPYITQQDALASDDTYYIKIGWTLIEQHSKINIADVAQSDKDVFVLAASLDEEKP